MLTQSPAAMSTTRITSSSSTRVGPILCRSCGWWVSLPIPSLAASPLPADPWLITGNSRSRAEKPSAPSAAATTTAPAQNSYNKQCFKSYYKNLVDIILYIYLYTTVCRTFSTTIFFGSNEQFSMNADATSSIRLRLLHYQIDWKGTIPTGCPRGNNLRSSGEIV
jgi:hypothetical protein